MDRIPIKKAKELSREYDYNQILILGWRGDGTSCVTTFGRTLTDCDQIAQLGNYIKKQMLKWPDNKCCAEPNRVTQLKNRIEELQDLRRRERP